MKRLEEMLERAYTLSAQVLNGDTPNTALAEEVSGECAELLSMLQGNWSAFESEEVMDQELLNIANRLEKLTT